MPSKPLHHPDHLYFVTATLAGWKALFVHSEYSEIPLQSLDWLRRNGRHRLYAFVIMPTHVHFINKPVKPFTISHLIQQFGSFTAHELLKRLRTRGEGDLLAFFQSQQAEPGKQHAFWQTIQAKNVETPEFLWEKVEYVHNNPVAKKWALAEERADYRLSSACYYDRGVMPVIEVDDVRSLFA